MSHLSEIAINAVNMGLSVTILGVLVYLTLAFRRLGKDVMVASLYLKSASSGRAVLVLIAGLCIFLVSNGLELYGDVFHIDWDVNEAVETISLGFMLLGLAWFAALLRVPKAATNAVHVTIPEARP